MVPLATLNKGTFIYLQSVGKALESTMISLVREVVFGVGFALFLPVWFGLDGVSVFSVSVFFSSGKSNFSQPPKKKAAKTNARM